MKNRLNKKLLTVPVLLAAIGLVWPLAVLQAADADADAGSEITRESESLRDYLAVHPLDPDRVNTALVFTNTGKQAVRVACVQEEKKEVEKAEEKKEEKKEEKTEL